MNTNDKWCPRCERNLLTSDFFRNRSRDDGFSNYCKDCHQAMAAVQVKSLRLEAIQKLGGKCCECGFSDVRALHLDHVNGDGKAHRQEVHSGARYYKDMVDDDSGRFQVLCANCHFIKKHERLEHCYTDERNTRRATLKSIPKGERPPIKRASRVGHGARMMAALRANPEKLAARNAAISAATKARWDALAERTTCIRGHDWTDPKNVYIVAQSGRRACAECKRQRGRGELDTPKRPHAFNMSPEALAERYAKQGAAAKARHDAAPERTACQHGHDWTNPANVYFRGGRRACYACKHGHARGDVKEITPEMYAERGAKVSVTKRAQKAARAASS